MLGSGSGNESELVLILGNLDGSDGKRKMVVERMFAQCLRMVAERLMVTGATIYESVDTTDDATATLSASASTSASAASAAICSVMESLKVCCRAGP